MSRNEKTNRLVLTALMICLVMLATFAIRVPSPFTQGYIHLGDSMIFLAVLLLGKKGGAVAGGLGSAMADMIAGYAVYAPWTFIIKGIMGFIMGWFIEASSKSKLAAVKVGGMPVIQIIGMVIAGLEMVIGYGIVDGVFAGNLLAGFMGAPFNVIQFTVGLVLATLIAMALYKTPANKFFEYRIDK